jgi:HK97 family phage portal protein
MLHMSRLSDLAQGLVTAPGAKAHTGARAISREPALYETDIGVKGRRITNRAARRHTQAYGGEDAIGAVMDCVDLYAQTTSNAEYHFERNGRAMRGPGQERTSATRGAAPPDLVALLSTPNRIQDWTELIELSVIDFLLAGEFFWYKDQLKGGKPVALYRISPALMDVVPGRVAPKGFVYNVPNGEPLELKPEEVVHVKRPNPHDPWRGLGVIAGDPRMYDIALAATESMAQYYEHGTRLSGVLESDRSIPPATFTKIKNQFQALYAGKQNHHKVATLERGLRFRPISGDASSADYKGTKLLTREEIAASFKVPLPLLGQVGSADRQAVKEAQRIFDNKVMRPFLNRLQAQITHQLVEAWGVDFKIDYEYILPYEDKLDLAQAMAAIPGVRVREVRELIDLPPLHRDDPELEWIDEAVLNLPGQDREEGGHPDRPLDNEAGRPPKGKNTVMFPRKPGNVPSSSDIVTSETAQKAIQEALNGTQPE